MAARSDSTANLADDQVVDVVVPVDGGYAWLWQWTYWPTAGASRTW